MIKCRECTKEMSSNAVACPHCGCPPKKAGKQFIRRWLFPLIVGLCTFSVLHAPFHYALDRLANFLPENTKIDVKDSMHEFFHHVFSDPQDDSIQKLEEQVQACIHCVDLANELHAYVLEKGELRGKLQRQRGTSGRKATKMKGPTTPEAE